MACCYAVTHSNEKDLDNVLKKTQETPSSKIKKFMQDSEAFEKLSPQKVLCYLLNRSLFKDDYITRVSINPGTDT